MKSNFKLELHKKNNIIIRTLFINKYLGITFQIQI